MPQATERESSRPTIAVVIPAYNAAPFIERAIQSAREQTHRVAEIVVVDDASTDSTVEVVASLSREDGRIKLVRLETNGGPARARNVGFAAASADWIAILDADDAYLRDRISHLMAKSDEADILADNLLSYDAATGAISEPSGPKRDGWDEIDLLTFADARREHHDFGLFQPVFRRSFLEEHKLRYPEDVRHGEDFILAFSAIAQGARYWLTWRPGYLYTSRNSGWSRTLVDYGAVAGAVATLCDRPDLKLSPQVRAKLRDRVAYSNALHIRECFKGARAEKRWDAALAIMATHPIVCGKLAIEKLRRDFVDAKIPKSDFSHSANYWELRYIGGGNSGAGSYSRLAKFKADFLNEFVEKNGIRSVIEFGSGDGAQLELARYPSYIGVDISRTAVAATRQRFATDLTKTFYHTSEVPADVGAELSLSLDVIYHLIEDNAFEAYMRDLFDAASRYVIVYSSNADAPGTAAHVRHREFTSWVERHGPDFTLAERVQNAFPYDESDPDNTSFADFYVFERRREPGR